MISRVHPLYAFDNHEILLHCYTNPDITPKASLVILHGMAEHHERYLNFIQYLVSHDFIVYAYNHRGHGKSSKLLGHFGDQDGWELVTLDAKLVMNFVQASNSTLPCYIFAHSMGSLIGRTLMQLDDSMDGIILSGTSHPSKPYLILGNIVATLVNKLQPASTPSKLLDKLSFGSYNRSFKPKRTEFDWLTRDTSIVNAYLKDEYCGFICSGGFFNDLTKGLLQISDTSNILKTRKNLPLFIISGTRDPVGNYGAAIQTYIRKLKQLGFTNIQSKLYKDGRHELLNELNQLEVYKDCLSWLKNPSIRNIS